MNKRTQKSALFAAIGTVVLTLCACEPKQPAPASFELPAVEDIVMYQVNPRVFAPDNSLNAVAQRIDSIRDLGVNVMWIMPIYPIGHEKGKNSPYCISNYTAVAPEFGTIDDFRHLVEVCHAHGMGIILDWVANHTAWDHPWLKAHPDWYSHDAETDTIIHPRPYDWLDVADLNYDNDSLRQAMADAMLFWVSDIGIDGFRCDVADEVPADFWQMAIGRLRQAAAPRRIVMLAEGKRRETFTVGGFDMNYAWDFKDSLLHVFQTGAPASHLIDADRLEYDSLPAGKVKLRFTTNHDESVGGTPVGRFGGLRGSMAAYVATVFLHGGALIYSSQEVGYPSPINFFGYVPVDWRANPDIYKEYKRLMANYNKYDALRKGSMTPYPADNVLAFEKSDNDDSFLILVNVRNEPVEAAIPATWKGQKVDDEMSGADAVLKETLQLAPYEYRIFALDD